MANPSRWNRQQTPTVFIDSKEAWRLIGLSQSEGVLNSSLLVGTAWVSVPGGILASKESQQVVTNPTILALTAFHLRPLRALLQEAAPRVHLHHHRRAGKPTLH